ncbi:DUF3404 domain-containing protein, partial [Halomonas marinisediminis]
MIKILVCILSLASVGAKADTLPERIDKFVNLFKTSDAAVSYDVRVLQSDYPTRLLTPQSMLPQTS